MPKGTREESIKRLQRLAKPETPTSANKPIEPYKRRVGTMHMQEKKLDLKKLEPKVKLGPPQRIEPKKKISSRPKRAIDKKREV